MILSVLLETGLDPRRLEIKITEGVLFEDFDRAIAILLKIRNLSVRIAMDDFGIGYSSGRMRRDSRFSHRAAGTDRALPAGHDRIRRRFRDGRDCRLKPRAAQASAGTAGTKLPRNRQERCCSATP